MTLKLEWRKLGPCQYGMQWAASLNPTTGEEIRVLVSNDPVPELGVLLHISCSIGIWGKVGAVRRCNDKELESVRSMFCSRQCQEEPHQGTNPFVRHLWEDKVVPSVTTLN